MNFAIPSRLDGRVAYRSEFQLQRRFQNILRRRRGNLCLDILHFPGTYAALESLALSHGTIQQPGLLNGPLILLDIFEGPLFETATLPRVRANPSPSTSRAFLTHTQQDADRFESRDIHQELLTQIGNNGLSNDALWPPKATSATRSHGRVQKGNGGQPKPRPPPKPQPIDPGYGK